MSDNENHVQNNSKPEIKIVPSKSGSCVSFPTENKYKNIKNKLVRSQQFQKLKREQKKVGLLTLNVTRLNKDFLGKERAQKTT